MKIAEGSIKRVIAFRLAPGQEIMTSIKSACEEKKLKNGIILSAIGSLDGARFFDPVVRPDKKAGYAYGEPIVLKGPIELLSMDGMICNRDGEILLHLHFSLSDSEGRAYGGHVIEGNRVLLTCDVLIGELESIEMGREYDEDLEVEIFNPRQL